MTHEQIKALAIECLADVTLMHAPAGKYVARDIRTGNLSPDNERAIWAMIEFAGRFAEAMQAEDAA